jgi:hypothetical protein
MTPMQKVAMAHTCKLPEETSHARFGGWRSPFSLRLTLNSGFE